MRPPAALVVANAAALSILLWLWGGDVLDAVRARSAEVAALPVTPRWWFSLPVVLAGLCAALVVLVGVLRRRDVTFKGYRLLFIVLLVAAFVDGLVLGAGKPTVPSAEQAQLSLELLGAALNQAATEASVPTDAAKLDAFVAKLGPPPYLVRGERPGRFGLVVRGGCEGPVVSGEGLHAATFVYCVSPEGRRGWVTLIALPAEERFGAAEVFTKGGVPQAAVVGVRKAREQTSDAGSTGAEAAGGGEVPARPQDERSTGELRPFERGEVR